MSISIAKGIQGGISETSGKKRDISVDHTQSKMSQNSHSGGFGFTGSNISLNYATSWGDKTTSEGTSFFTPSGISRMDHRHEDKDTRGGISFSGGMSLDSGKLTNWGVSFLYKGQNFGLDSKMISAWTGSSSPSSSQPSFLSSAFGTATDVLGKVGSVTSMASNVTSAITLSGGHVEEIQGTLNDINVVISKVQYGFDSLNNIQQLYAAVDDLTSTPSHIPLSIPAIREEVSDDLVPLFIPEDSESSEILDSKIFETDSPSFEDRGGNPTIESKRTSISQQSHKSSGRGPASLENPVEDNNYTDSSLRVSWDNQNDKIIVSLTPRDFSFNSEDYNQDTITRYVELSRAEVGQLEESGTLGLQWFTKPDGFLPFFSSEPIDLSRGFTEKDPNFVKVFSLQSRKEQELTFANNIANFGETFASGCLQSSAESLIFSFGPQALVTASSACFLGGGKSLFQSYVPPLFGEVAYQTALSFNFSKESAELTRMSFETGSSIGVDHFLNPRTQHKTHIVSEKSTLVTKEKFTKNSSIQPLDKRGAIKYDGIEIRGVRDFSHLSDNKVEAMIKKGVAPHDIHGNSITLHHLDQKDHRLPDSKLVMI
jgi:hypothetical protein